MSETASIEMQSYGLVEAALQAIKAGEYTHAVWRLVDAAGMLADKYHNHPTITDQGYCVIHRESESNNFDPEAIKDKRIWSMMIETPLTPELHKLASTPPLREMIGQILARMLSATMGVINAHKEDGVDRLTQRLHEYTK